MNGGELPIFAKWLEFLKWLLPTLEKFPKKVRFTITNRLENMALDVAELMVEARYSGEKRGPLKRINLQLEKMRVLFRIAHHAKVCPTRPYHFASQKINEVGVMLGGWIRQQEGGR